MPEPLSLQVLLPKWPTSDKAMRKMGPIDARKFLEMAGGRDAELSAAQTNVRFALGMLLLVIQDEKLFESHHLGGYGDWSTFLNKGVPDIAGIRSSVASEAMRLARSKTMQELPPEERGKISISNANTLAKVEKSAPEAITPEVVSKAQQEAPGEFRRTLGVANGVEIRVWVKDPAAADAIERICRQMATLSADAAAGWAEFLDSAHMVGYAGDGADNRIHALLGHIQTTLMKDFYYEGEYTDETVPQLRDKELLQDQETRANGGAT